MSMNSLLTAGLGICALGLVATTAQAAPGAGLAEAIGGDAARTGAVENVTWYGSRYDDGYGYRHRRYGYHHYRPYYGYGYRHYYRPYYRYRHHHYRYGYRW